LFQRLSVGDSTTKILAMRGSRASTIIACAIIGTALRSMYCFSTAPPMREPEPAAGISA
jgi:hypothetical protein